MTGKDLFIALGDISPKYYDEAEDDTIASSQGHKPLRRPLLIAAVIAALLLLVGCGYVVLSGAEWFQSYFTQRKGQPLSQGQTDYIAQNTKEIGQSVTVNGYTVTVESAIAEPRTAYIKLRLEGPRPFTKEWIHFNPRWTSDDHQYMESAFYRKGSSPKEQSLYGGGSWVYDDPVGNTISILIRLDQSHDPAAPSFEAGIPYTLHLTDLTEDDWGEERVVVAEGEWNFDIVFDQLQNDTVELISQPAIVTFNDVSLNLTSLKLHTMGVEATFDAADERCWACFAYANVVLKDGTTVAIHPTGFDPSGSAGFSLDCPIDLEEVDYVKFRDGTRFPMP